MSQQIIQINFQFNVLVKDFENIVYAVVNMFSEIPGLQWKIWLLNEARKEAGGIYLFADKEAVHNYKNSGLFQAMESNVAFENFSVKEFDIMESPSMFTSAPIDLQGTTMV